MLFKGIMQLLKTKIRKENSDSRRADMITATLRVIARDGVRGATVRTISKEANVTQGLIRYYFQSKDELIAAAYVSHMEGLVIAAAEASQGRETALGRMAQFVRVALRAPVTSHEAVSIWAGFFELLLHDQRMLASHVISYEALRGQLQILIEDVFQEQGWEATPTRMRHLSIAGNAILDGLWIEGGAMADAFEPGELEEIAVESFSALLGVDLKNA